MSKLDHPEDTALAAKIAEAVKAVDVAIANQTERAKAAGLLLHDAHKRHPGRKAFEKFLKLCGGLQYSRAMELIAVATDRKTFEKLKADNATRQQKHRDKKKSLPKPEPKVLPKPNPSVTSRTNGSPEVSAEARSAEFARLYPDDGAVTDPPAAPDEPKTANEPKVDEYISNKALLKFMNAVDSLFPQMNASDLKDAYGYATLQFETRAGDLTMRKAS